MHLSDILNTTALRHAVAGRYISEVRSPCGRLTLYNYTEKATFDRLWTPETRQCRGLIVETGTGNIVAWPLDKFHNAGELPETAPEALAARPGPVEITDKLDGSMVTVFSYAGELWTATRGSFVSTQARAALMWWVRAQRPRPAPGVALVCEWVAPDNRVVLPYERAECVLLAVRGPNGGELSYQDVAYEAAYVYGLRCAPRYEGTLAHALGELDTARGVEGWVVRWPDGSRVKLKTAEYLALHRLVTNLTPARVRDAIVAGTLDEYLMQLPEEFRREAERYADVIHWEAHRRDHRIIRAFERLQPKLAEGRKAFALAVQSEAERVDWPHLFALADGRSIYAKLVSEVDVAALFGAEAQVKEAA